MSNDSLLGEYGYFLESHCSRCRVYCRRQEETAILISTHALHVCTQHSFGLPLRMNGCSESNLILHVWTFYHSLYDDACFDHLSLETYTKHSIRVKAFWLLIVSPALCNLWLLLVCVPVFLSFSTQETYFVAFLVVPYFTLYVFSHFFFWVSNEETLTVCFPFCLTFRTVKPHYLRKKVDLGATHLMDTFCVKIVTP